VTHDREIEALKGRVAELEGEVQRLKEGAMDSYFLPVSEGVGAGGWLLAVGNYGGVYAPSPVLWGEIDA
jgi:hypothetical protein